MTTPTITFLGAARNVTGSRFLLEDGATRILVDCGLYQERDLVARNWDNFPVEPSSIDAVLLTHAHLDHSGYLPRLVADGFQGPVYCTEATADIVAILLEDSARIQTVHRETNPRYHALLRAFKARTGCPVLVNTSFNVRGEPIVCTPEDAFRCFMGTGIEVLAAGNCLLRKEAQNPSLKIDYKEAFELD